jgi:hypothetical protein
MGRTRWFQDASGDARMEKEDGRGRGSKLVGVVSLQ